MVMQKVAQKNMSIQGWVIVVLLAIVLILGLTMGVLTAMKF